MKKPSLKYVGDRSVRALLARYACPIPFHAVRTRFLGNIATPKLDASPVQTIKSLWGGKLPEFDDMAAVNELFEALMSLYARSTAEGLRGMVSTIQGASSPQPSTHARMSCVPVPRAPWASIAASASRIAGAWSRTKRRTRRTPAGGEVIWLAPSPVLPRPLRAIPIYSTCQATRLVR